MKILKKIASFFYKDTVFLIALILAVASLFITPISKDYLSYIDPKVLIVMFSLMVSVAGMMDANLFSKIAIFLSSRFYTIRAIALVIVWSTFFIGMWITNDAVLLTLVPFAILVTKQTNQERHLLMIVILQTFAANMGSSLTPMGDPQNIYLYSYFHIAFGDFLVTMAPITITSFVLITVTTILFIPKDFVHPVMVEPKLDKKKLPLYLLIFALTLVTVIGYLNIWILLPISAGLALLFFPKLLKRIDVHLLLTFAMFFIITGNLKHWDWLNTMLSSVLSSKASVYFIGLSLSQVMSNVPASVLLSTFTSPSFWPQLIQGVNVGAMGSLIASLASLISFKFVSKNYPKQRGEYIKTYTLLSVVYILLITLIVMLTHPLF